MILRHCFTTSFLPPARRLLGKPWASLTQQLHSSSPDLHPRRVRGGRPHPPPSQLDEPDFVNPTQKLSVDQLLKESKTTQPADQSPEFPSDITDDKQEWKEYNNWVRDQARHSYRPKVDPKETSIFLFPGQGSQFVGMGDKLVQYPGVEEMYDKASEILGYDLLNLCTSGPKEELDRTLHCQPALLVTSLAAVESLKHENPQAIESCIATAGFSVGEYAALVFAGVMSFEDAVSLIKVRALEMQKASERVPSGMMTVFLSPSHRLNFACHTARRYCTTRLQMEGPVCEVANYLYPECKVLAGHVEALEFIENNCKDFGIRRCKRLPVSGAFHTKLMTSAKQKLERAIKSVPVKNPIVPVHTNVTGYGCRRAASVLKFLPDQIVKPVCWEQTMHVMYSRKAGDSFPDTYEFGPGAQLGAMLKMTNRKAHEKYTNIPV